jgi:hypothetical protein
MYSYLVSRVRIRSPRIVHRRIVVVVDLTDQEDQGRIGAHHRHCERVVFVLRHRDDVDDDIRMGGEGHALDRLDIRIEDVRFCYIIYCLRTSVLTSSLYHSVLALLARVTHVTPSSVLTCKFKLYLRRNTTYWIFGIRTSHV